MRKTTVDMVTVVEETWAEALKSTEEIVEEGGDKNVLDIVMSQDHMGVMVTVYFERTT